MATNSETTPEFERGLLAGFMTAQELARQLGISCRTLARWHAMRIGPARCAVGKLILYRTEAVRDWLASREQGPERKSRRRR